MFGAFLDMNALITRLNHLIAIADPVVLFTEVMQAKRLKDLIINLNTGGPANSLPTSQLWNGIDSLGRRLENIGGGHPATGLYSPLTIEGLPGVFLGKKQLGLPFDRITLYNTGEFYGSFDVETEQGDIVITANPQKGGSNLTDDWGPDIIGLTDGNVQILIPELQVEIVKFLKFEATRR